MKVAVLQQYLRNLLEPFRATGASAKVLTDLERTCQELEAFKDKDVCDLAEFLRRAKTYEEQGNWPVEKTATRARKRKEPINLQETADRLRSLVGSGNPEPEIAELAKLSVPEIRQLLRLLEISDGIQRKLDGQERIRLFLAGVSQQTIGHSGSAASEEKLTRIVETLKLLKEKADAPEAPFDEIEAELHSLERQLGAREAKSAAKALGVIRTLANRADALDAIRRKVLAMKYASESIAY
jgi:hypothetical protein